MIKTLKIKFIKSSMTAIIILVVTLLGGINIANIILIKNQIDRELIAIVKNYEKMQKTANNHHEEVEKEDYENREKRRGLDFFVVELSLDNKIINMDLSRLTYTSKEDALELVNKAIKKDKEIGNVGSFRYLIKLNKNNTMTIGFLETVYDNLNGLRVLCLSLAIGLLCLGAMLIIVIILSNRAIKPIAENFEKQKEFVTNAGHEIKTPLSIILSNTEAMELYNGESKWSKNIKEQVIRLNGLMNNLLSLSRAEEVIEARLSNFNLSSLIKGEVKGFLEPMSLKGIDFNSKIEDNIELLGDSSAIRQLLSILLDNALKYTPNSGRVFLELKRESGSIALIVENTCGYIEGFNGDRLFDRFYRGDKARTYSNGGYGIGLSAAKAIAKANKGSISVSYNNVDTITFKVMF